MNGLCAVGRIAAVITLVSFVRCAPNVDAGRAVAAEPSSSPSPVAGTLVVGAPIVVRDARVHAALWSLPAPKDVARNGGGYPLVAGGGAAYFPYENAPVALRALATDGTARWSATLAAVPTAYAAGLLYVVEYPKSPSDNSRILALDAMTGKRRWETPGVWCGIVRGVAIVATPSRLEAREPATGTLRWSSPWNGYPPQTMRLVGTTLLLRTEESGAILAGELYAYDIRDGRALWTARANDVVAELPDEALALDTTWPPDTFDDFATLTVDVVSLASGARRSSFRYAPDPDRWRHLMPQGDRNLVTAIADGVLVFGVGDAAVYRYTLGSDPAKTAAIRYDLRAAHAVGTATWLVVTADRRAALADLRADAAVLHPLPDIGAVQWSGVVDGLGVVAGSGRAIVFDPAAQERAVLSNFPCTSVDGASFLDDALVILCDAPEARAIGLTVPQRSSPSAGEPPIALSAPAHAPPLRFRVRASDVPARFVQLGGAAFAADGTLWFCEHTAFLETVSRLGSTDAIGHLERDGTIREFPVPTNGADVRAIVRGPDGAMWFTEASAGKLGRVDRDGAMSEFPMPADVLGSQRELGASPRRRLSALLGSLASGADGALWITAPAANEMVRVTVGGTVREFAMPAGLSSPGGITRGPDGALWFDATGGVGRIALDGTARAFLIESPRSLPMTSIVWGPDGNLWFSFFDGRVGRITTSGDVHVFPGPVVAAPSGPLIGGCDGALYMADDFRRSLWRVTTAGAFTQADVPYIVGHLARSADCTFGFTEGQGPAQAHVGTIRL